MKNEVYGSIHHSLNEHEERANSAEFKKMVTQENSVKITEDTSEYFAALPDGRRVFDFAKCERDEDGHLEIDFDRLIATRDAAEIKKNYGHEWSKTLEFLKDRNKIDELYKTIFERITNETNYLQDLAEIETDAYIIAGLVGDRVGGRKINWRPEDKTKYMNDGAGGFYNPANHSITALIERPDKMGILNALITEGSLPWSIQIVAHEAIHAKQHPLALLSVLKDNFFGDKKTELTESQAQRQGNTTVGKGTTTRNIFESITQSVKTNKESETKESLYKVNKDRLIYALRAVEQLDALGFTVSEVAAIIDKSDGWNSRALQYDDVQEVIDIKLSELGLDEFDLDNLVQAHSLERQIDRLRAWKIAQEEATTYREQCEKQEMPGRRMAQLFGSIFFYGDHFYGLDETDKIFLPSTYGETEVRLNLKKNLENVIIHSQKPLFRDRVIEAFDILKINALNNGSVLNPKIWPRIQEIMDKQILVSQRKILYEMVISVANGLRNKFANDNNYEDVLRPWITTVSDSSSFEDHSAQLMKSIENKLREKDESEVAITIAKNSYEKWKKQYHDEIVAGGI